MKKRAKKLAALMLSGAMMLQSVSAALAAEPETTLITEAETQAETQAETTPETQPETATETQPETQETETQEQPETPAETQASQEETTSQPEETQAETKAEDSNAMETQKESESETETETEAEQQSLLWQNGNVSVTAYYKNGKTLPADSTLSVTTLDDLTDDAEEKAVYLDMYTQAVSEAMDKKSPDAGKNMADEIISVMPYAVSVASAESLDEGKLVYMVTVDDPETAEKISKGELSAEALGYNNQEAYFIRKSYVKTYVDEDCYKLIFPAMKDTSVVAVLNSGWADNAADEFGSVFSYENIELKASTDKSEADMVYQTLGKDIDFSVSAEKTGDVDIDQIEAVYHVAIPEEVVMPEEVSVNGDSVVDEDGNILFTVGESSGSLKASLKSAELDGQIIDLDVLVENCNKADDPFDGWLLTMHGGQFKLDEEQLDDIYRRIAVAADTEDLEFPMRVLDTEIQAEAEITLSSEQFEDVKASAETKVSIYGDYDPEDFIETASLSGTLTWGINSVPFDYGQGCFWGGSFNNTIWGSSWGAQKTCTFKNDKYSGYKYRLLKVTSKNNNAYVQWNNCGYTFIDGNYVPLNVRVYLWSNAPCGITAHGGSDGSTCWIGAARPLNANSYTKTKIEMEFHFYRCDNGAEVSMKGATTLRDMDDGEGYKMVTGVRNIYTTRDCELKQATSGTYNGYIVGTKTTSESNDNTSLLITFDSTPSAPLHIRYGCQDKYHMNFNTKRTYLTYHLSGTVPNGAYTPSQKVFVTTTQTVPGVVIGYLNSYTPIAGYSFSGWHVGSMAGGIYGGDAMQTRNVDLYGEYYKQYGHVQVNKSINGIDANSVPDANKNFGFRLYGTGAAGDWVDQTIWVVAGNSGTFWNIPVGTYTLNEIYDGNYWSCNAPSQTVVVSDGQTSTHNFTNTAYSGNLTIHKTYAGDVGILNQVSADTKKVSFRLHGTSSYASNVDVTKEINGNGDVSFTGIPIGSYTVDEIYDGNIWSSSAATFTAGITNGSNSEAWVTNTLNTGSLKVHKAVAGLDDPSVIPDADKTFEFTLSGQSDAGTPVNIVKTVIGGQDALFEGIPVGTYTLTESYNADLWDSDATTQQVRIDANQTKEITATNTIHVGNLTVNKTTKNINLDRLEDKDKTFTFKLQGTSLYNSPVDLELSVVGEGSVTFENVPVGTYTLTEVYKTAQWISSADTQEVAIKNTETLTVDIENAYRLGNVTIKKFDSDGRTPLAGVQFQLSDDNHTVATTDSNGEAFFKDVLPGRYQITEIKTAPGKQLLSEPFDVEFPLILTDEEVASRKDVDITKGYHDDDEGAYYFFDFTYYVTNNATLTVPSTGANGTWYPGILAAMFAGCGCIWYSRKKRRMV